jgi:hypothetical protein
MEFDPVVFSDIFDTFALPAFGVFVRVQLALALAFGLHLRLSLWAGVYQGPLYIMDVRSSYLFLFSYMAEQFMIFPR